MSIFNWNEFNISKSKSKSHRILDKAGLTKFLNSPSEITELAKAFSKNLLKEIGAEKLKTVIEDNKKETSDDVCHSHDMCDANMVMLDAFNDVGIDLENDYVEFPGEGLVDTKSDSAILINIWNKAWGEAKKNDFYTK